MKKVKNITPVILVITYSSPSGDLYDLYVNGMLEKSYNSLSELTRDIQAIIRGKYEFT